MSDSLWPHGLYSPWNSPGKSTVVGSLSILQRIFPNQGLNPGLPHCRQILYQLSPKESPRILEWVAYPFSSRSSQPRDQTRVSCIAGRFFNIWLTREAGDGGSIPGLGRSPGEGNDYPLRYSCLENYTDRGAWWAQSTGSQRVGQDWVINTHTHTHK